MLVLCTFRHTFKTRYMTKPLNALLFYAVALTTLPKFWWKKVQFIQSKKRHLLIEKDIISPLTKI